MIEKTHAHMFIQKKPKWNISCRINKNLSDQTEKDWQVSFTMYNFQNFVPPDGDITDFNIHSDLGFCYKKLKVGIYETPIACCLITETPNGIYLLGISHNWEKLRELIAKIISSAGMEPTITHATDDPLFLLLTGWTKAVQSISRN